ncbi:MAG: hypothetical protein ABUS57_04485 [Pseudomonadota bacterium]
MSVVPVIAAQRMRKERRLVTHLREQGALSAASATGFGAPQGMSQAALRGLLRHGAVQQTSNGAYWLDEPAYTAMRAKRQRNAFVALTIVALIAVAIFLATFKFA